MSTLHFEYTALDRGGNRLHGVADGSTKAEAYRKVAAAGLTPLALRQVREKNKARGGRIRTKDVAHFTYQFSVLISARIAIGEGLMSIAQQETNAKLREVITDIASRIESGEQIASAMGQHVKVFGDLYLETVRAAERTGNLPSVLEHLSEMLERQRETTAQIRSALMYPACVISVLCLAVTFLIGFVIPKFAKMFAGKGIPLPIFTRLLMGLGQSMQSFWWAYGLAIAGAVVGVRTAWKHPRGRVLIDNLLHKVPFLGTILTGLAVGRFARIFGLSISSGVGLIDGLELSSRGTGRAKLIADANRMIDQVKAGGRLKDVLATCHYLPPFAKRMLAAGEESAELPKMCSLVARHYERETMHLAKNLTTVIEPIMVVLIGMVVLVVALAIFLPMWDMVKLVQ